MDQIEQAVIYALGPQVDPNVKAQVKTIYKPPLNDASIRKRSEATLMGFCCRANVK